MAADSARGERLMADNTPTPPAGPAKRRLVRRDFLTGTAAGVTAGLLGTRAATAVVPTDRAARALFGAMDVTYAQAGEDIVIQTLLEWVYGLKVATYLDVGAYEPILSNNTYLLYRLGGRGVLVEPNPDLTAKLRRTRPRDTVLPVGIGISDDPSADFYVMADPQLHTFDKDQAERLQREGASRIVRTIKMPLVNINAVIADHFGGAAPDVLSIDIEGLDFAVLKTLDFAKYRPKVICAETIITNTFKHNPDTLALLTKHGYAVRGMTYANTVFADATRI